MTQPSATGSLSPAQAQLFIALMEAQSQNIAASLTSDALDTGSATGDATTSSSQDFASLLNTALLTGATTPATTAAGTSDATSSASGNAIANVATQLAGDLRGANFASYDATLAPSAAQAAWNTPGWGNGNIQCVAFVDGVFRQAGITLPATPNGVDFWSAYQGRAGWQEIANGQGLPQPGDIITFAGGAQGFGHVAVVTQVTPPSGGQPGSVTFAQSNSPSPLGTLPIAADGSVTAWPGYQAQGFIRANG